MAITLVQSNFNGQSGTLVATPPPWSVATTAGNLLVVLGCEVNGTMNTWPTLPAGYTVMPSTPFIHYNAGITGVHGGFSKIAAGSDATCGTYGETTSTQDWETIIMEFANPGGWLNATVDVESHTAVSSTQQTSKAGVALAALAQAVELAIVLDAHDISVTSESYASSAFAHVAGLNKLQGGWLETASAASGLNTTASWTTSARAGIKLVTFRTAAPASIDGANFIPGKHMVRFF